MVHIIYCVQYSQFMVPTPTGKPGNIGKSQGKYWKSQEILDNFYFIFFFIWIFWFFLIFSIIFKWTVFFFFLNRTQKILENRKNTRKVGELCQSEKVVTMNPARATKAHKLTRVQCSLCDSPFMSTRQRISKRYSFW